MKIDNTKFLEQLTSGGKKSAGVKQTPSSLQQKFWGFIKQFLQPKLNSTTVNSQVSRCPFAALLNK